MTAGVLVLHAWWGLNDDVRAYARRLQGEGFAVETPDMYGEGRVAGEIPAAEALMKARDKVRQVAEIDGAADRLAKRGPYAVVGWSMGGSYAWDLVERRPATVAALVDHYGGGEPAPGSKLPPILGHYGELDDDIALFRELDTRLRDAGQTAELHFYPGAHHWFAEPSRPQYDPNAAALAWDRTLRFLKQQLG
ncbi:MAG TPA: alpha/beta fold hydrolase [Candidatus Limnocylindria bacterium]|nr:alpha/beta fold hydrolase [Candidatus Limnocylindria bacterium]